jgi:uroporphyrinogen decarboxylase
MTEPAARYRKPNVTAAPCFENLLKVLERRAPSRPTLFEFFMNNNLYADLVGCDAPADPAIIPQLRWVMQAYRNAGYDYTTCLGSWLHFTSDDKHVGGFRAAGITMIHDRASFDAYAWPDPDEFDYSALKDIAPDIPKGMRLIVCGPGGVLENAVMLVGYENLCCMIAEEPELADDIFERIGSIIVRHYEISAPHDTVGACLANDDWGFKTQPMFSPDDMRRFVFPWHKRIVETIHAAGKPAILHSCGNQELIYDDIIDVLGYDGKHSYEDIIQPVEDAWEQYGSRIAILGGIDLDYVCRSGPRQVYERSKAMLERTATRGSFALGTGNSVPPYVPMENYYAMIAAAVEAR